MSDDLRTLPHDLAAERAVLGSILVNNDLLASVVPVLSSKDFFRAAHRYLFEQMVKLADRHAPIDYVTICDALASAGTLDECGGPAYISGLTDGVPRSANVEAYCAIVRQHAMRRQIITTANNLMAKAYDADGDVSDLTDKAGADLYALGKQQSHGQLEPLASIMTDTIAVLEKSANTEQKILGLATGFTKLDKMLGGLRGGQFIIIAARPSLGKTSLVTNIAQHVGQQGKSVAFFSLEMSKTELCVRLLSSVAQVSSQRMMRGSLDEKEWAAVSLATGTLSDANIYIDDTADLRVIELRSKSRAMKASTVGLDLIIIDYMQLMPGEQSAGADFNRQAQVSAISRACKLIAKELDVPVIGLSQLSRKSEERTNKRPMLSDLRESGGLEQDADVVLLIHREEVYKATDANHGKADIIVAKQRNGATGEVGLSWVSQHTRFENITAGEMYD